jgi:uncharacterized protein (TIGR03083 family)
VSERLAALRLSSDRLRDLVEALDDRALARPAYPQDWSVADVLSHIGSSAVIMARRLVDSRLGVETPDTFAPTVWDEWNAKDDRAKATDGLAADRAYVERLEELTDGERASLVFVMGPLRLGFEDAVSLRLNEHALHTWDVEVAFNPSAVVPDAIVAQVVDHLELIAGFTGRPTGATEIFVIATTDPERHFKLDLTPDAVSFGSAPADSNADTTVPAEQWIRLVYGRMDPADPVLRRLVAVFPGP